MQAPPLAKWGLTLPDVQAVCPDATLTGGNLQYSPVDGYTRFKRLNHNGQGAKYWSRGEQPALWFAPDFQADDNGTIILASGDMGLFLLAGRIGLNNVLSTFGETTIPADLPDTLAAHGVTSVLYFPDLDAGGDNAAQKLADILTGSGIELVAHRLPGEPGSKADLNDTWVNYCTGGDNEADFLDYLAGLHRLDITPTERASKPDLPDYAPVVSGDVASLWERYSLEVERAAVAAWNIRGKKNFSSPLREDHKPSASWDNERHGFYDFTEGEFFNTHQVAELLGFVSWEQYKADHLPPIQDRPDHDAGDFGDILEAGKIDLEKSREAARARHAAQYPTYWPDGVPVGMICFLSGLHKNAYVNIGQDYAAAALVLLARNELITNGHLAHDCPVFPAMLADLSQEFNQEWRINSKQQAEKGLNQVVELLIGNKVSTTIEHKDLVVLTLLPVRNRVRVPKHVYTFKPVETAEKHMLETLGEYAVFEQAYLLDETDTAAPYVMAESRRLSGLDRDQQAELSKARPVDTAAIEQADQRHETYKKKIYGWLNGEAGTVPPPSEPVTNATELREHLARYFLELDPDIPAAFLASKLGLSPDGMRKMLDRMGKTTIPHNEQSAFDPHNAADLDSLDKRRCTKLITDQNGRTYRVNYGNSARYVASEIAEYTPPGTPVKVTYVMPWRVVDADSLTDDQQAELDRETEKRRAGGCARRDKLAEKRQAEQQEPTAPTRIVRHANRHSEHFLHFQVYQYLPDLAPAECEAAPVVQTVVAPIENEQGENVKGDDVLHAHYADPDPPEPVEQEAPPPEPSQPVVVEPAPDALQIMRRNNSSFWANRLTPDKKRVAHERERTEREKQKKQARIAAVLKKQYAPALEVAAR